MRVGAGRRGVALLMVLCLLVVLEGFGALALLAALQWRAQVSANRVATEGVLLTASALAELRVGHGPELSSIADGAEEGLGCSLGPGGWEWCGRLGRRGSLLTLAVRADLHGPDGTLIGARSATLLLARFPSDTVRVLVSHPRL